MNFRNYGFIFITGLAFFAILIMQSSSVYASQAVFDEIENFVSLPEEIQIDKPIEQDLSEPEPTDIEEQPVDNNENQAENEDTIQNTKPNEEKTVSEKETITRLQQKDITEKTPQVVEDKPSVTESEEQSVSEEQQTTQRFSISKFFVKCRNLFSRLSFDRLIVLKEKFIKRFSSKKPAQNMCCRPIPEHKIIVKQRDIIPYYVLYPETIEKHLEKIVFTYDIVNPKDLLPYDYAIKHFEEFRIEAPKNTVTPQGTTDIRVLLNAPSPKIKVAEKDLFAKIVIDIRNNTLYKYDEDGFPLKAYLVATGARGTRTMPGLRIVTYKEKFPYKGAPKDCKRLLDPYSYGPYIIFLNIVNPKTGKQRYVDQFLHGNGNERSIGRKVSHGCVRMNNNVMRQEISKEVNRGDYVLLINPDLN